MPLDDAPPRGTVGVMTSALPTDALRELAHELRSPLMALSAACDLVADEDLADAMRLAVSHMRGLLADHLVREQPGGPGGPFKSDLSSVVSDAVSIVSFASAVPVVVVNDAGFVEVELSDLELRRAVVNIVSNAVRFSPPGSRVQVQVGASDRFGVLEVRDFGPGVPADLLTVLGSRPVDSSTGFGVGLFLARSLLDRCGGSLTFSLANPGLRARLELPLAGA